MNDATTSETNANTDAPGPQPRSWTWLTLVGGLLGGSLLWLYWPTLTLLIQRWSHEAIYSHGYLVPVFAGFLLWSRRQQLALVAPQPSWWGLFFLGIGLILSLVGVYYFIPAFVEISLLPLMSGFCVLLGGWPVLRWAWPGILFLIFMLPLPATLEEALRLPLQGLGTQASVYCLQTLGFLAHAEGNVIVLREMRIGVVEACNGLGMLMTFVALSSAVVILIHRSWVDKVFLLLSAIPIALICNITRITVTGICYVTAGERLAHLVFHDLAGWLMIPMALGLLWAEVKVLNWVFLDPGTSHQKERTLLGSLSPVSVLSPKPEMQQRAKPLEAKSSVPT